jgi:excisionase family DNA binding protein
VVATNTEELLSLPEAAERLGVSIYTVRRWIKDGKLRAFRPGKEYRVQEADLEEFLAAREVRPKEVTSPSQRSLSNRLEEKRGARWDADVQEARQLRKTGRPQMLKRRKALRRSTGKAS